MSELKGRWITVSVVGAHSGVSTLEADSTVRRLQQGFWRGGVKLSAKGHMVNV